MALPIKRGEGGHEQFSLPAEPEVGGDIAMVGGNDEGPNLDIDTDNENWDLPAGGKKPAEPRQRTEREDPEPADEGLEDARLAYDDTGDSEPEERESRSRRARRNQRRREYMDAQAQHIQVLNQKLEALGGVVERLTTGQAGLAVNTIDGQITSLQQALRMADQELADAVAKSDGAKYSEVNALRDEVVGRLFNARQHRERMAQGGQMQPPQQRQPGPPQQQQPQVDPALTEAVQDKFERFQDRFPWFDPQSPDSDCNIVRAIDGELLAQGYQRHTPVFWQMLEQKMARYGLKPGEREDDGGEQDERLPRRSPIGRELQGPARRQSGPPTGSGRSTRATNGGYALSEWQRDALRDEGLLEDNLDEASVAKRDRIIGKWRKGQETLRRRMN